MLEALHRTCRLFRQWPTVSSDGCLTAQQLGVMQLRIEASEASKDAGLPMVGALKSDPQPRTRI